MKIRKAFLALGVFAAVAVTVPATPAGASTSFGRFSTLTAGADLGLDVQGYAILTRTSSATSGRVFVYGLEPGATYAAHLHNLPCSAANPGGGHYQNVGGAGITPPNELWFSSSSNPLAGITANAVGVAVGRGRAEWVARPEAQAVIIHFIPPNGNTGGGPKIACADL